MNKILIVDDLPENRMALEALLNAEGEMAILFANGGNEALKLLLKSPDVSLVLMDVHMPEMSGFEAASLLQQLSATRSIPVVFVTADDVDAAIPEEYQGFLPEPVYLHKPISTEKLRAVLETFRK